MKKEQEAKIEKRFGKLEGRFDALQSDVEVLKDDVKVLKGDVHELKDSFGFMLKKMDENQRQNERYFQILIEQTRYDISGVGEGVKANRDRLDSPEDRLRHLEAS